MTQLIIQIKRDHKHWGPKKIFAVMPQYHPDKPIPSISSIGNILHNHNLTMPRKLRRHVAGASPLGDCHSPNDVWMYDFKGWFLTGDGKKCEPFTVTDGYSRYLLNCVSLKRKNTENVWNVFEALFREYGLPLRVRSDNGPPFATTGVGRLSPLTIKLIKVGVMPEWIEPGKPQQNGQHERFHLTLKNETASPPAITLGAQERLFEQFKKYYNEERPHEALGQKIPSAFYEPSKRVWDGKFRNPEYSSLFDVRKVMKCGSISWLGQDFFLSQTLYGEYVAIKDKDDGIAEVYYGPIKLGEVNLRKGFKRT